MLTAGADQGHPICCVMSIALEMDDLRTMKITMAQEYPVVLFSFRFVDADDAVLGVSLVPARLADVKNLPWVWDAVLICIMCVTP